MQAHQRFLGSLFNQNIRLKVPLFQRPYVWKRKEQLQPLWKDVRWTVHRHMHGEAVKPHFLGALVLQQMHTPTGLSDVRQVIDGQQRLMTLQLMLSAARDLAGKREEDRHERAFEGLTRNDLPLAEDEDELFKVWPRNADRKAFTTAMSCQSPKELKRHLEISDSKTWTGDRIADCYIFYSRVIENWLETEAEGAGALLTGLLQVIQNKLSVVVIDLDDEDSPQVIFETLNARGTPLLPSDLVKNFLFYEAKADEDDQTRLYRENWKMFDDGADFWREEVARGRWRRPRIDHFMVYYLSLARREDTTRAELFEEFRKYVRYNGNVTPRQQMSELAHYGRVFKSFHERPNNTREGVFFERLEVIGTTTLYPFLLQLFDPRNGSGRKEVRDVLGYLESYLVRRLVCNLTTKNYNRLFLQLVQRIGKGPVEGDEVADFLREKQSDATRWPKDEEFKAAWLNRPVYGRLAQKRIRMILEALEAELQDRKSEELSFEQDLTIEHLMPRRWEAHWPLPDDVNREVAVMTREESIDKFGNLTLLTRSLNPAVSNGPWQEKRKEIAKFSKLNLNMRLTTVDEWTEQSIEERGKKLFSVAKRVWPGPRAG